MSQSSFATSFAVVCAFLAVPGSARASQAPDSASTAARPADGGPLAVYLDCATHGCDSERFRQDITFVDWVRDPGDADLHVILTSQSSGGGGQRYTVDLIGEGPLEGLEDRIAFTSGGTDVDEEVTAGLSNTLALALVRFAQLSGTAEGLSVRFEAPDDERAAAATPEDDPWNAWVFRVRAGADIEREDRQRSSRYNASASANRTTDFWKIDLSGSANWHHSEFELNDSSTFVNDTDDWTLSSLVVRSLDDHWSVGFTAGSSTSTRRNQDLSVDFSPAVEWNYYPWQEATRRRFVALYSLGLEYFDYEEPTIYDKETETLARHSIDLSYRSQETWGDARVGAEATQILGKWDRYSFEFSGRLEYRLTRGLNLSLGGSYEVIRDQIFLSGAGLSDEEILIQRRQLATGSRLSMNIGLSFQFGSIFNNVVNARFPSEGGGGRGFFF